MKPSMSRPLEKISNSVNKFILDDFTHTFLVASALISLLIIRNNAEVSGISVLKIIHTFLVSIRLFLTCVTHFYVVFFRWNDRGMAPMDVVSLSKMQRTEFLFNKNRG